jgi:hypothetical protein
MERIGEYIEPVLLLLQQRLGLSQSETFVVLYTIGALVLVHMTISLLFPGKPSKPECCISKFVQQRKAAAGPISIPASSGGGRSGDLSLGEIHQQLTNIFNELQQLRQEREVVDHELIETSTQILQAIGASFVPIEDEDSEDLILDESPPIVKPVATRGPVQMPSPKVVPVELPKAPTAVPAVQPRPIPVVQSSQGSMEPRSAPVAPAVAATVPAIQPRPQPAMQTSPARPITSVQAPAAAPVAPAPAPAPGSAGPSPISRAEPDATIKQNPIPTGPPAVKPAIPTNTPPSEPAQTSGPKMSALAMARLKREQELSEAKSAPPALQNPSVGNPFSKPKPAPFGAPVTSK